MPYRHSDSDDVHRDKRGRVRSIRLNKPDASLESLNEASKSPKDLADEYLRTIFDLFGLPQSMVFDLSEALESKTIDHGDPELHFQQEKVGKDSIVVSYAHTRHRIPVWNSGVAVRMRQNPMEVVGVQNEVDYDLLEVPPVPQQGYLPNQLTPIQLAPLLGLDQSARIRINGMSLVIYRYEPAERTDSRMQRDELHIPLPAVRNEIQEGKYYIANDVLFSLPWRVSSELNWRALIEVETGSVLYLRPLVASCTGLAFVQDPISQTGRRVGSKDATSVLDPLRQQVTLLGLAPPSGTGKQALAGEYVRIEHSNPPAAVVPEASTPFDFGYPVQSSEFAAVNAYYHCDALFRLVASMGFNISQYFDGTTFPVPIDHYCLNGDVDAQVFGNPTNTGVGGFLFGCANNGGPVGIVVDPRVVWHEFGHAVLWDHVRSPFLGFAHNGGDALGAIFCDPDSRAHDKERFETFPFMVQSSGKFDRRHDRDVATGWAWGGSNDDRDYNSEQILSTTLFRIYRACGGDSKFIDIKRHASRYVVFLILKAIGSLTMLAQTPQVFVEALTFADLTTGSFEGFPGGVLHKVIRWSFEKQGLYQPAGALSPVTSGGLPPEVDVYVEDGRKGEYMPFLADGGESKEIWNRLAPDGQTAHQPPVAGTTNNIYVRIHNRGTNPAQNVTVEAFHATSPKTATWPGDWKPRLTASLIVPGPIPSGGETVVGPFPWSPSGPGEGVLVTVDTPSDLSLTSTVTVPIPTWLLTLLDNNIAKRTF